VNIVSHIKSHTHAAVLQYRATEDSIAAAKAWNAEERAKAQRDLGLMLNEDGVVANIRPIDVVAIEDLALPLSIRLECSEKMSALVEEFGFQCVLRSFRCEAAANDLVVRVLDANDAEDY